MLEQIKALKPRVIKLLTDIPRLRDSDRKLIATIWHNESKGLDIKFTFLQNYANGMYSSSESITRARRKAQEQHPELRGKVQLERERLAEEVRVGIHEDTKTVPICPIY